MHDSMPVRHLQRAGDLNPDRQGFRAWDGASG